jgi:hypothetical protein
LSRFDSGLTIRVSDLEKKLQIFDLVHLEGY